MRKKRDPAVSRQERVIHLTYFRDSGRYFTEYDHKLNVPITDERGTVDMEWIACYLRELRDTGRLGSLPGLKKNQKGWPGFILIDHEDGFPYLVKPPVKKLEGNGVV